LSSNTTPDGGIEVLHNPKSANRSVGEMGQEILGVSESITVTEVLQNAEPPRPKAENDITVVPTGYIDGIESDCCSLETLYTSQLSIAVAFGTSTKVEHNDEEFVCTIILFGQMMLGGSKSSTII